MGPRAQLLTLAAQCGHTHAEARFSARAGPLKRLSHTIGAALELCWGSAAVDGQRGGDTVDVWQPPKPTTMAPRNSDITST